MASPITRPADLVRLTMQFNLQKGGVNQEVAEFDTWWRIASGATPASWDTFLLEFATASYTSWKADLTPAYFPASLIFGQAKASRCDDLGHVVNEQVYVPTSSIWGGASGSSMPWQLTDCVGLYSFEPSGFTANARRKRGRIYLPPMQATELHDPDDGEMLPALSTAVMEAVNNWIVDTTASTYSGPPVVVPELVILSLGPYTTAGSPAVYPVTWLRNDTVWDTQRRRRDRIVPTVDQLEILGHIG